MSVSTAPVAEDHPVSMALEQFEYLVNGDETEKAGRQLLWLLQALDAHYGAWPALFSAHIPGVQAEEVNRHVCTRVAGAVTTLFSRPAFGISDEGFIRLMGYHRWLALIFAVSGYGHADHIIRNINAAGGGCIDPLSISADKLRLFCLCYHPDSQVALQPAVLWEYDKETVVRLFFALLSQRCLPSPESHAKREYLLAWLPEKLLELGALSFLPTEVLHDVYMHCSYADLPEKHQIKRAMNTLIRNSLLSAGYADRPTAAVPRARKKPVMMIIVEWFNSQHSVYRTHSEGFRALRKCFRVHGVALPQAVDEKSEGVFDVCHKVNAVTAVDEILALVRELQPDVVYYSGIGMFPHTIYLSNLRLAPLQLVGLGHGASTFSEQIDYFVAETDFIGDEQCFSEKVLRIPADGLPFVPPEYVSENRVDVSTIEPDTVLKIAVCASVMKINPGFLTTLQSIVMRSERPIQFCFYLGFAHNLMFDYLQRVIQSVLPSAKVNAHMPRKAYMAALAGCEFFVSPFPYGNMNGISDCLSLGLPGICLSGGEIHAHIDEGLLRRVGLPEALIAGDKNAYIDAAVKLAADDVWRQSLKQHLLRQETQSVLYTGRPAEYARCVYQLYQTVCG